MLQGAAQVTPIPDQAIRDTIAVIVGRQGFQRSVRETALERFFNWIGELLQPLTRGIGESRVAQRVALVLVVLLVVAVIARAIVVAYAAGVDRADEHDGARR